MKGRYAIPCALLLSISLVQAEPAIYVDRTIEREGVSMRLRVEAIDTDAPLVPYAGQFVRLRLDGKRLGDAGPLRNWNLGAWLDRQTDALSGAVPVCGQRVAGYLSGNLPPDASRFLAVVRLRRSGAGFELQFFTGRPR